MFINVKCVFDNCSYKFTRQCKLKQHILSHLTTRKFKCQEPGCNKSFKLAQHLRYHVKTHYPDEQMKYPCTFKGCGKVYAQHWILRDHLLTHVNKYKFECIIEGCNKKYNTKSNFEIHLRKHANLKPFSCPNCHQRFISNWNLSKHTRQEICKNTDRVMRNASPNEN